MDAKDLKKIRKDNGISQRELAEYLGVGQSFISQMERGACPIPDNMSQKILENPEWTIYIDTLENHGKIDIRHEDPAGDHIEQNGSNNIGKIGGSECSELLALRKEVQMLKEQNEELKAEKAAYWEMIKDLTKKWRLSSITIV